jgi:hypothetical protein
MKTRPSSRTSSQRLRAVAMSYSLPNAFGDADSCLTRKCAVGSHANNIRSAFVGREKPASLQ